MLMWFKTRYFHGISDRNWICTEPDIFYVTSIFYSAMIWQNMELKWEITDSVCGGVAYCISTSSCLYYSRARNFPCHFHTLWFNNRALYKNNTENLWVCYCILLWYRRNCRTLEWQQHGGGSPNNTLPININRKPAKRILVNDAHLGHCVGCPLPRKVHFHMWVSEKKPLLLCETSVKNSTDSAFEVF